jgi:hypothetical protein
MSGRQLVLAPGGLANPAIHGLDFVCRVNGSWHLVDDSQFLSLCFIDRYLWFFPDVILLLIAGFSLASLFRLEAKPPYHSWDFYIKLVSIFLSLNKRLNMEKLLIFVACFPASNWYCGVLFAGCQRRYD